MIIQRPCPKTAGRMAESSAEECRAQKRMKKCQAEEKIAEGPKSLSNAPVDANAGEEAKQEAVDEYDDYYACLMCGDSVRGAEALKCSQCDSNPFHRACVIDASWLRQCPSCMGETVTSWSGAITGPAVVVAMIDLVSEDDGGGRHEVRKEKEGHGLETMGIDSVDPLRIETAVTGAMLRAQFHLPQHIAARSLTLQNFIDLTGHDGANGSAAPRPSDLSRAAGSKPSKRRKIATNAASKAPCRPDPPLDTARAVSRQDAVLRAITRIQGEMGCNRQIWEAMTGTEKKAFANQTAMNRYCQEQARLYGKTAWLDSSVRKCECSSANTSASHGAVYYARGDAPSWARIDEEEKTRFRDTFKALDVFVDGEVNLRGEIMTVDIVAMRAMLTRRPNADGTEDGRQGYEKFFEARTIPGLVPGRVGTHRGEFHTLAKLPMHSHGDKMAVVCLHLRHVEDCTAAEAREKHYDALGGEACARFLRRKEQQEYDAHRREGEGAKSGPPSYKFLAIYEIVSITRVAGGVRTTQPHSAEAGAGETPEQRHQRHSCALPLTPRTQTRRPGGGEGGVYSRTPASCWLESVPVRRTGELANIIITEVLEQKRRVWWGRLRSAHNARCSEQHESCWWLMPLTLAAVRASSGALATRTSRTR